ncbi:MULTISPECIES: L-fucose/L-arabinose isomerase family protein [unclassified Oceanispirochaeta]|uniref:L-fucose/L-arabinose isomerase family protein n=1 Tax=unclassified Oceanispirochaeta TaxID=2635722 RepID=UPI000E09B015|nr:MULTISPECIES: L-fucose/L-arabinose isomerase family protein [unclassified Oceanispirochaeta]MBF9014039.1 L-fucose/L-arabinose isomerase family protein [Oceanispirochaeta sp. M2]NPD70530.1 L-fucose/L-arabinose isomerase family protein [Oceanispirochaeta sp. M1]RDG34297.1 arabinose isomerase [Oceanispirochaeta sp. M1]
MSKSEVKIAVFGIGLDTYWPQFEGLEDRLKGYLSQVEGILDADGVDVISAGLVDSPEKARSAAAMFRKAAVELVFCYITTYALSSTVLPVAQEAGVPVILLNVQPVSAIDYKSFNKLEDRGVMTGEWLAHCQACSVPEIAGIFNPASIPYRIVTGYLGQDKTEQNIREWVDAAKVYSIMKENRLGILGHYYGGMLDVYTDLAQQSYTLGTHIEILEMCELAKFRREVTDKQVDDKIKEFEETFVISEECEIHELIRAARTSVALDRLVEEHQLGSLAYYYEGQDGNEYEDIVTSVIAGNTLLTGRNIPVAGECEVKNAQAMKILDSFGAGGSFSEYYGMDFDDDIVMLGHDGPAHFAISQGDVGLVPLSVYHGKPGKGLSIQMTVKHGPVTLLSVVEGTSGLFLLVAEGECVPGPVLEIGNTNSRYRFSIGAEQFMNEWSYAGPTHHCAIGTGLQASRIQKFGLLAGLEVKIIC